jgi:hypothetical protein
MHDNPKSESKELRLPHRTPSFIRSKKINGEEMKPSTLHRVLIQGACI